MSRNTTDLHRRRFLRGTAAGIAAFPIAGLFGPAQASDMPRLDPSDPQAKALQYVHDASDATEFQQFKEGSNCANCMQWQGGDSEWGGCPIFPGKAVSRNGWCTAWAKQAG